MHRVSSACAAQLCYRCRGAAPTQTYSQNPWQCQWTGQPSQTWLISREIAISHSPVHEHRVLTERWDFSGPWNQGNVYTTRGRLRLKYMAVHCVDFPAQELISTHESKPKASQIFSLSCLYHTILLTRLQMFL